MNTRHAANPTQPQPYNTETANNPLPRGPGNAAML
jgi:hypothetical protein